jgi:hypothetical protein
MGLIKGHLNYILQDKHDMHFDTENFAFAICF